MGSAVNNAPLGRGTKQAQKLKKDILKASSQLRVCVDRYNAVKFDGASITDLREGSKISVEDQMQRLFSLSDDVEIEEENSLEEIDEDSTEKSSHEERLTVAHIMKSLSTAETEQFDWRREFWRHLDDIYHCRNRLKNAIDHYQFRIEFQWPEFEREIQSISPSEYQHFLLSHIRKCKLRDQVLVQRSRNVYYNHEKLSTIPYLPDQLKEIGTAFMNGTLSKQHYHRGIHPDAI